MNGPLAWPGLPPPPASLQLPLSREGALVSGEAEANLGRGWGCLTPKRNGAQERNQLEDLNSNKKCSVMAEHWKEEFTWLDFDYRSGS